MRELKLVTGEPAELLLDFGSHPVSHKFLRLEQHEEHTFPIQLGIGKKSGLIGLIDPPDWRSLTPVYPWVQCNEPEDHLDDLAGYLATVLKPNASVLGLSSKDKTLLNRLFELGCDLPSLYQHSMLDQLVNPGVEVVQAAISEMDEPVNSKKYDLVVGRHILEHTWQTEVFLKNVVKMLADDGLAVLEVPDNGAAFRDGQHTIIWEEHSLYFTELTLKNLLAEHGFSLVKFLRYPMALEDVLVVVLSKEPAKDSFNQKVTNDMDLQSINHFVNCFAPKKQFFRDTLQDKKQKNGAVAILGAGHLGAAFINYYELSDLIDVVIDDDANKQGLLMPGSRLPIKSSKTLERGEYSTCLLTCNPWNNEKIATKNQQFIKQGGRFLSIFQPEKWS